MRVVSVLDRRRPASDALTPAVLRRPGPTTPGRSIELPGRGRTWLRDIAGPDEAPALMLLHGLGATARLNWGRSFRPLSQEFRVLSLDQRGHGGGIRTAQFRLEDCADDAAAAAHVLGVERFIAVGYSMGGPIAALTWQRHRERVAGLVLCATAGRFVSRGVARLAGVTLPLAATAARWAPAPLRRQLVQRMLVRVEHTELRDRVRNELLGHEPATVIQAAEAVTRFSTRDWIGTVDVPTAVLVTTRDRFVAASRQYELAASIPGAEVFEVSGDHDACGRIPEFAPTLVRACRSVARRAAMRIALAG